MHINKSMDPRRSACLPLERSYYFVRCEICSAPLFTFVCPQHLPLTCFGRKGLSLEEMDAVKGRASELKVERDVTEERLHPLLERRNELTYGRLFLDRSSSSFEVWPMWMHYPFCFQVTVLPWWVKMPDSKKRFWSIYTSPNSRSRSHYLTQQTILRTFTSPISRFWSHCLTQQTVLRTLPHPKNDFDNVFSSKNRIW